MILNALITLKVILNMKMDSLIKAWKSIDVIDCYDIAAWQ